MKSNRLEAFSDGVLAIIITIMVLELKVPHGTDLDVLEPLLPVLGSYVLSFLYVGIYWNNPYHPEIHRHGSGGLAIVEVEHSTEPSLRISLGLAGWLRLASELSYFLAAS